MQAQAYEGYFEDGRFYPLDKIIQIKGRKRALVTIFEEPDRQEIMEETADEERVKRILWLEKLESAVRSSADEEYLNCRILY